MRSPADRSSGRQWPGPSSRTRRSFWRTSPPAPWTPGPLTLELFGEINKGGQTILMVTHSVKAASHAGRVLFLRDGRVYHQLYRGSESREAQFRRISDTLTVLTQGGENHG